MKSKSGNQTFRGLSNRQIHKKPLSSVSVSALFPLSSRSEVGVIIGDNPSLGHIWVEMEDSDIPSWFVVSNSV